LVFQPNQPTERDLSEYYGQFYKSVLNRDDASINSPSAKAMRNTNIKSRRIWNFYSEIMNKSTPITGNILDIGASTGNLLNLAKGNGFNTFGVEPNENFAQFAKAQGHQIEIGLFTKDSFSTLMFDTIFLVHVLEHVANPLETLKLAKERLAANGTLILEVPNLFKPNGRLEEFFSYPHLFTFNKITLSNIVEKAGFSIIKIDDRFPHLRLMAKTDRGEHKQPTKIQSLPVKKIKQRLRYYDMLFQYSSLPLRALRRLSLLRY